MTTPLFPKRVRIAAVAKKESGECGAASPARRGGGGATVQVVAKDEQVREHVGVGRYVYRRPSFASYQRDNRI